MSSAPDLGDDVVDALSAALTRAQADLDALADAAGALQADPTGPIPDFTVLAARRDARLLEVGRALTRAVSQGFQLVLEEPVDIGEPVQLLESAPGDEEDAATVDIALVPDAPELAPCLDGADDGAESDTAAQSPPESPPREAATSPKDETATKHSEPATEDSIQRLSSRLGSPSWTEGTPGPPPVAPLAKAWGSPDDPVAVSALLTASKDLGAWLMQPREVQTRLLAYATLRCRHAQEKVPARDADAMVTVFRRLTAWSKKHQPGYVYGLARDHTPDRGSWLADARAAWQVLGLATADPVRTPPGLGDLIALIDAEKLDADAICRLTLRLHERSDIDQRHLDQVLEPHLALLKGDRRFKRIKKRIKKRKTKASPKAERTPLETDWAGLEFTQGKRALMVGGDYRHQTQQKLQDALGFAEVHWDTGWEPRRTASCAERIRSGRYDLVLLVRRFLKHRTTDVIVPACKDQEVPLVPVPSGYGLRVVKEAIENQLRQAGGEDEA